MTICPVCGCYSSGICKICPKPEKEKKVYRLKKVSVKKISLKRIIAGANKKAPKTELKRLIKALDEACGDYIKARDKRADGLYKCVTCTTITDRKGIQWGHYHSRKHFALRWDGFNTACQCVKCNIFEQGKQHEFGEYIKKRYGEEKLVDLEIKKNNKFKLDAFKLTILLEEFRQKTRELLTPIKQTV